MIDEIQAENLALIKNASFEPGKGLTVLSGETGAGKTALLTALKLLMGFRSDKLSVRQGAEQLRVSGRFYDVYFANKSDEEIFEDNIDEEMIVERTVSLDGRSRVSLNGHMASVNQLREMLTSSIDLCGQHEQQNLFKISNHTEIFDKWAGVKVQNVFSAYEKAYQEYTQAKQEFNKAKNMLSNNNEKLDEAKFILSKMEQVNPQQGEYEDLVEAVRRAENAENIAEALHNAQVLLDGDRASLNSYSDVKGAMDALVEAADVLDKGSQYDEKLVQHAETLRECSAVLDDVHAELSSYEMNMDFSVEELAAMQDKIAAYQGLMRQYGPTMKEVFETLNQAQTFVDSFSDVDLCIEEARRLLKKAEDVLKTAGKTLAETRAGVSGCFESAVNEQMQFLDMGKSRIVVVLNTLDFEQWTSKGPQNVEFCFEPSAGMNPMPLNRIASGGEISRVMLALKVVAGTADCVQTLVFDEVDAGVGGKTAIALGKVLSQLAKTHQVIVVTHLPQIAARAQTHYVVKKVEDADCKGEIPETIIEKVTGNARIEEIARMLSGEISKVSLDHATQLLIGK